MMEASAECCRAAIYKLKQILIYLFVVILSFYLRKNGDVFLH